MKRKYWLGIGFLLVSSFTYSKSDTLGVQNPSDTLGSKGVLNVLPVFYFTPETLFAFGFGAAYTFQIADKGAVQEIKTYESLLTLGGAYTLRNQLLFFSNWRIFTPQNKNIFVGELGFYDYVFFYFGMGNDRSILSEESYTANLQRLRFDYFRKYSSSRNVNLGLKSVYDYVYQLESDPLGELSKGTIIGSEGGRIFGIGPAFQRDTRDSQLFPTSGMYIETSAIFFSKQVLSDFPFTLIQLDVRKISKLNPRSILAIQLLSSHTIGGEVPFFYLPMIGGNRNMRGLFEGKFRDSQMTTLQSELRRSLHSRWNLVLFSGVGNVYQNLDDNFMSNLKFTYGTGVRYKLKKDEKLNLRFDIASSPQSGPLFYLTFGEAF